MAYLSEILGREVRDNKANRIGTLQDVLITSGEHDRAATARGCCPGAARRTWPATRSSCRNLLKPPLPRRAARRGCRVTCWISR
ncbi:MAG: PRC-barrel domain-containing protein [Chloroflexi bacterium]|nr:PRC-barrel domain-containing protein [Chloroflexota bacterium]